MTIEERVELLHQSIESHDRQIGELVERQAALAESQARTAAVVAETSVAVAEFAAGSRLSIERLATAMLALNEHSADHKARIERLQGRE